MSAEQCNGCSEIFDSKHGHICPADGGEIRPDEEPLARCTEQHPRTGRRCDLRAGHAHPQAHRASTPLDGWFWWTEHSQDDAAIGRMLRDALQRNFWTGPHEHRPHLITEIKGYGVHGPGVVSVTVEFEIS